MAMFSGLSAFPLTPLVDDRVDLAGFKNLVRRLVEAGVDSIGVLGSTGSYAYLSREERASVVAAAVEVAGKVPIIVGIGALRTSHAVQLAADAQAAGASAVMLAPMTYQALSEDEVYGLFRDVTFTIEVPLIVYDNPGTTHFKFTVELYRRIASLPNIGAIKIPPVPASLDAARERVAEIRTVIPAHVRIGISGDAAAATALMAGCDLWFSSIGGTLPSAALKITKAALNSRESAARTSGTESPAQNNGPIESERLRPMWDLMAKHGSLRVAAAAAAHLGLTEVDCLPHPVLPLSRADAGAVARIIDDLDLR